MWISQTIRLTSSRIYIGPELLGSLLGAYFLQAQAKTFPLTHWGVSLHYVHVLWATGRPWVNKWTSKLSSVTCVESDLILAVNILRWAKLRNCGFYFQLCLLFDLHGFIVWICFEVWKLKHLRNMNWYQPLTYLCIWPAFVLLIFPKV